MLPPCYYETDGGHQGRRVVRTVAATVLAALLAADPQAHTHSHIFARPPVPSATMFVSGSSVAAWSSGALQTLVASGSLTSPVAVMSPWEVK